MGEVIEARGPEGQRPEIKGRKSEVEVRKVKADR